MGWRIMKVLAINGSAHRDGNTAIMITKAFEKLNTAESDQVPIISILSASLIGRAENDLTAELQKMKLQNGYANLNPFPRYEAGGFGSRILYISSLTSVIFKDSTDRQNNFPSPSEAFPQWA